MSLYNKIIYLNNTESNIFIIKVTELLYIIIYFKLNAILSII